MAADPNDIIQQFTQALAALEARLGQSAGTVRNTINSFNDLRSANMRASQAFSGTAQAMQGLARSTNDARSAEQAKARFQKTMANELADLARAVHRGTLTHAEGDQAFQQMIAAVRNNTDLTARQRRDLMEQLIVERRRQDGLQRGNVMMERFNEAMQTYGINAAGRALQNLGQAYQSGGVAVSNFAGKAGITGASLALQGFFKVIEKLGSGLGAVAGMIPGLGTAGKALQMVGIGGGHLTKAVESVIMPVFDFLSAEFNKQLQSFQQMSSAGAIFSDGIIGMNRAAAEAGINTQALANVLKNNAEDISKTGMGMAAGAKMIGEIGLQLKKSGVASQLAQLGYTAEEITDMVAQKAGEMKMGGGQASTPEIAAATAAYAKDLRTLQAITGEDVRQREKEAKAKNNTLAFNQKLMEMEPKQRAAINAAMAGLSDREQAILREKIINNGQAFTKESLMYESMVDGTTDKMNDLYDAYTQNSLTLGRVTDANQQYAERQGRSIQSQKELAFAAEAGVGAVQGVARDMNEGLKRSMQFGDAEAVQKTRQEVEQAYSTQMEETTKTLANYEIATKAVEAQLNLLVSESGALKLFGTYIGFVNDGMIEFAKYLTRFAQDPGGETERIQRLIGEATNDISRRSTPQVDPMTGAPILGTSTNPMHVTDPAVADALRRGQNQPPATPGQIPGLASGGMVDFPTQGSLAMLHGREAVIPLPSGLRAEDLGDMFKNMQEKLMNMDTKARLSEVYDKMSDAERTIMNSKITEARSFNMDEIMERLSTEMSKLNDGMERMISETRNISTYTERTARGVA